MKLLWRIVNPTNSLWRKWIYARYMHGQSIWAIKDPTSSSPGTWMWKQILKIREKARGFVKVEVQSGTKASFWFDRWTSLGPLVEMTGSRGFIDMGISPKCSVAQALSRRRRRHRLPIFNTIEDELDRIRANNLSTRDDIFLWRHGINIFKPSFDTKATWNQLQPCRSKVTWSAAIWFRHHTPKYAFHVWIAILNRLPTGDRLLKWSVSNYTSCVFCLHPIESRNHLFFECPYSFHVWKELGEGVFGNEFTSEWSAVVDCLSKGHRGRLISFLMRYLFQVVLYHVWMERNRRRHGENPTASRQLIKTIDKVMKNRFNSIRLLGDKRYEKGFQAWIGCGQSC